MSQNGRSRRPLQRWRRGARRFEASGRANLFAQLPCLILAGSARSPCQTVSVEFYVTSQKKFTKQFTPLSAFAISLNICFSRFRDIA